LNSNHESELIYHYFSLNTDMYTWKSTRLIVISFIVYIFVNMLENLIHYNIGKSSNKELEFNLPTKRDWIKIIVVMCTFALLQGLLTVYFNS
jgi:hypothetical protein